jgi:hypothetical protein
MWTWLLKMVMIVMFSLTTVMMVMVNGTSEVEANNGRHHRSLQGTAVGQIKLVSSASICTYLSIPQATCPSITECMLYYTNYYSGTPNYYQYVSNGYYSNSACCPSINGINQNGVFVATQGAGAGFGTSTVTITKTGYSNLQMRIVDQYGSACSVNYYVVWGTVLGAYPSSNSYNK